jgi:hypothetical protein
VSARDVTIDSLSYADLLKIAIEELPGASQGEWTLHGPIDPGITMLELFAWQFEQRLFMADQRTEQTVRAGVRLLGLADPAPARPACTVLSIAAEGAVRRLEAGTVFALDDDAGGRRFALDDAVWLMPVTAVRAAGRLLRAGDALELELEGDLATPGGGGELSVLVEVAAPPGVGDAWRGGAATGVQPPAELRWEAVGPDGTVAAATVRDSTGALRRSGILHVTWPDAWDATGSAPRRLRATAVSASYTEPVHVLAVHPNAAVARHRVAFDDPGLDGQLAGLLPLPGQRLRIPGTGAALCDGEGDVVLAVTERSGERHAWTGVRSWVGIGPADRVFLVDRPRGELRFGDGRRGRIMRPAQTPSAALTCFVGAGPAGNLGRSRGWVQADGPALASNPVAAEEGADAESIDGARQRAADALVTRDRAVTALDTAELAETTPGLGLRRADVSAGFHPAFPCHPVPGAVAVTIVPHADRDADGAAWTAAPQPDAGALATTRARMQAARLLGQEIAVLAPVYRRVTVEVEVSATARSEETRARVVDVLRRHLDPLVGGSEHAGWPFGGPVRPSALSGVVQRTIGAEATVTRLAAGLDDGPLSDCADLAIGPRELVFLGAATVRWVVAAPAGGGLR